MISRIEELLRNNQAFVWHQLRSMRAASTSSPKANIQSSCGSVARTVRCHRTVSSPGDMFVHRNIASLVVQTEISPLSVPQHAINVLKVNQLIVCGH
ncbi:hypothetical protein BZM27_23150 [Paraburkholderia steynii]|uniref:carbonic anhydrase n=1 Tax=Paraburkholderia steynii TaxID=1245441 RepID=A0A4R0X9C4_9BURK|nr:hypothetical protein BZM27_23150 [Paraburkholderia steynii]